MRIETNREQIAITKKDLTRIVHSMRESRKKTSSIKTWPIYDSDHNAYKKHFSEFKSSIENVAKIENPVIIDLLSSSSAIRGLFLHTLEKDMKGISVALEDLRPDNMREIDRRLHVTHLVGDLGKPSTWDNIKKTLGDKKANLILERGYAGVAHLPQDPLYFLYAMNKIWSMLSSSDGTFIGEFIQINIPKHSIYNWSEDMQKKGIDTEHGINSIKLIKHLDSPEKLPK